VDVAIVGGGIAGLAVARKCVLRGLRPCVIEARDLCAGASGRNAGFAMTGLAEPYTQLIAHFGAPRARRIWEVSQENLREILDLCAAQSIHCDLVSCGSVVAAWTLRERDELLASQRLLAKDGFDARWVEGEALADKIGSTRYHGAIFVPQDHGIHPVKFVRGLADYVRANGGLVLEHHEVRTYEQRDGTVVVHTSKGPVVADKLVLSTNAYTRNVCAELGALVSPTRGQVLCTEPTEPLLKALVYTDDGFQYARQLPDNRVVAGGWRRDFASTEVGLADEVTAGVQAGIESWLHESWPSLKHVPISHRWSGTMGFSPDGLPLVGKLASNIAYGVGFTGHGLGFALAVARAVMAALMDDANDSIFAANRLRDGGAIKGGVKS
jgi:glycine/D-amino acid oxidase-like deaminating enzyme